MNAAMEKQVTAMSASRERFESIAGVIYEIIEVL
jgi:hypothetical protein